LHDVKYHIILLVVSNKTATKVMCADPWGDRRLRRPACILDRVDDFSEKKGFRR
jgi:hypothetical protein